jgi:hypothetical protein
MGQVGPDSLYRAEIYARFWRIYLDSPLFGYGLNAFTDVNLTTLGSAKEARDFSYIHAAHNHILQLLLAGGWPFLLAHVGAIGLIVKRTCEQSPFRDAGMFAIWLGLLIVLGCSMTDIALTVPAILSLIAAIGGHIWGRAIRIKFDAIAAANKPKSYYSRRKKEKEQAAAAANVSNISSVEIESPKRSDAYSSLTQSNKGAERQKLF